MDLVGSGRTPFSACGVCAMVVLLLCGSACSSSTEPIRLDVYDWWDQPSEQHAFDSVIQIYAGHRNGVDIVNVADDRAPYVRDRLARRMLAGAPPATFQANIGADLLRWTMVDTENNQRPSTRRIQGLAGLFQRTGLADTVPDVLLKALRVGDTSQAPPYAVPIDVHRLNVLYVNAAAQLYTAMHPDKKLFELTTLCPSDPDAERLPVRLALGAQQRFPLVLLAFENLLPALAGPDFYESFLRGEEPRSVSPPGDWRVAVRRALHCTQYLAKSAIKLDESWADAVKEMRDKEPTFMVMGDWAGGQLAAELDSREVEVQPFPGTDGVFVFTSDTFPLPIGTEHSSDAEQLLETLASEDAQQVFSESKGSIPARRGIVVGGPLAVVAAQTQLDFDAARKVAATSAFFPPYYPQAELGDRLFKMVAFGAGDDEIENVIELLRDAMPSLAKWQARMAQGPSEPQLP